jgi:hypothetical protein
MKDSLPPIKEPRAAFLKNGVLLQGDLNVLPAPFGTFGPDIEFDGIDRIGEDGIIPRSGDSALHIP